MTTVSKPPTWVGRIIQVDGEGPRKARRLSVAIERGPISVLFPVSRRGEKLCFTDTRETLTGQCLGSAIGATPSSAGEVKRLTAAAWVAEVSRLIGKSRAEDIVDELIWG